MILKWWSKDERALAPRLKFCSSPVEIACWYRYQQVWYRYQKCIGTPQPWGTGTSKCGTSTTASLHVGTGTSKCGTGTTASATSLLHCSTTRGLSTVAVINSDDLHLFSRFKPLQKCTRTSKNLHTHKNARNDQRHLFYTK